MVMFSINSAATLVNDISGRIASSYTAFDEHSHEPETKKVIETSVELERKLAIQKIINRELTKQHEEVTLRSKQINHLDSLTGISENDKRRLNNAMQCYDASKDIFNIRFDYTKPANICKGYIKNENRRLLQSFEMEADPDALWNFIKHTNTLQYNTVLKKSTPF